MRPILVAVIWLVLVGGLLAYVQTRDTGKAADDYHLHQATGGFRLEATTTFDVEPDPFALTTNADEQPAAFLLKVNGAEAVRLTERLKGGAPIVVEPVPGLVEGKNELFVEAVPPLDQAGRSQAIRVRLLCDGHPIADHTLWSEPGSKIATAFPVFIENAPSPERRHDH